MEVSKQAIRSSAGSRTGIRLSWTCGTKVVASSSYGQPSADLSRVDEARQSAKEQQGWWRLGNDREAFCCHLATMHTTTKCRCLIHKSGHKEIVTRLESTQALHALTMFFLLWWPNSFLQLVTLGFMELALERESLFCLYHSSPSMSLPLHLHTPVCFSHSLSSMPCILIVPCRILWMYGLSSHGFCTKNPMHRERLLFSLKDRRVLQWVGLPKTLDLSFVFIEKIVASLGPKVSQFLQNKPELKI